MPVPECYGREDSGQWLETFNSSGKTVWYGRGKVTVYISFADADYGGKC